MSMSSGRSAVDPGTEWGTGLTSTADNTLRRKAGIEAGDPNGSDPFNPALEWDGFATDTFGGLGSYVSRPDGQHLPLPRADGSRAGGERHRHVL